MVSSSEAKVGALQSASTLHLAIGYRVHQHASRSQNSARIDLLLRPFALSRADVATVPEVFKAIEPITS